MDADLLVRETDRKVPDEVGGKMLLAAAEAATQWLATHRDAINALNVFPVPDGDTGTNMLLTMQAAVNEGQRAVSRGTGADIVCAHIARGALLGARGNSGVILSQIIRGFALAIEGRASIDGRDLATGLDQARDLAYRAVLKPVEGTMLTVIRVAAEYAQQAAAHTSALPAVLAAAIEGAKMSLETTPELLAILHQAGVVDAGGQGIVRLLEGIERYAAGDSGSIPMDVPEVNLEALPDVTAAGFQSGHDGGSSYGYCTNFIVFGEGIVADQCRDDLAAMGDSIVVVGDDSMLKVHLHTSHPGQVLEYAVGLGDLDQIKIDNMQLQTQALAQALAEHRLATATPAAIGGQASGVPADGNAEAPPEKLTVVAVAAGDGLARALRSMGAGAIVAGGQTMNPSIQELLAAVDQAPTDDVILLTNNPNIILTANQVAALTEKRVAVVPSRSLPQGIAALSAFSQNLELGENARRMTGALRDVRSVEITRASRDATIGDIRVEAGQVVGLVEGRLVAAGDCAIDVTLDTLRRATPEQAELVTIFWGEPAIEADATALAEATRRTWPDLTTELHPGGQPHYLYTIAVE